jgi:hypothetical protein
MREFDCKIAQARYDRIHRTIFHRPGPLRQSRRSIIFRLPALSELSARMIVRPSFQIVCVLCDAIGITLDHPEDAPSSTLIKCSECGAPRGTLGELRSLASSNRQDLLEF